MFGTFQVLGGRVLYGISARGGGTAEWQALPSDSAQHGQNPEPE